MKRKFFASIIIPLTAFLVYSSCTKIDATDLGDGLIPAVDNINTFEAVLDVITDNKLFEDTTDMAYDEDHGIGIIEDDPEFGKTTATLYASFTPPSYKTHPISAHRADLKIDSVILSLAYTQAYGDSTSVQEFEVRQMDASAVFGNSLNPLTAPDFPVLPTVLGTKTVNYARLKDSVMYKNGGDTIKTPRELRIPLDTSFGRMFVNYDTLTVYNSDTAFKAAFKGLQIIATDASPIKKAISYYDLSDNAHTRITFYCRSTYNGRTDTIAQAFTYTADPEANIIRRTPAHGYLDAVTNVVENDEKLFIQSAPGSYATVKIPGLAALDNRVIHRAELIAEREVTPGDPYAPPSALFVDALNLAEDSAFTLRNDFSQVSEYPGYDLATLGGVLKSNKYVFNLTRYVQSLVTKKMREYTLRIHAPFLMFPNYLSPGTDRVSGRVRVLLNRPVGSGRTILYGGGSADPKRMRCRIIYSKI